MFEELDGCTHVRYCCSLKIFFYNRAFKCIFWLNMESSVHLLRTPRARQWMVQPTRKAFNAGPDYQNFNF